MKGYLSLLRINCGKGYYLMGLLGFLMAGGYLQPTINIILFFFILFLYLGFSFSINECFDVKEDKMNPSKNNPIAKGKIIFKNALVFSFLLFITGLVLSSYFGLNGAIFYSAISLISFCYSVTPIRLKSRFILDIASHILFFGIMIYFMPFFLFGTDIKIIDLLIGLSVMHLSAIFELGNHLRDQEWDKKAKVKTTVTELGISKSRMITQILVFTYPVYSVASYLYLKNPLILLIIPIFYFSLYLKNQYHFQIIDYYATLSYILILSTYLL
jgi:4-hydroxybenzoate polyprenyltransferase